MPCFFMGKNSATAPPEPLSWPSASLFYPLDWEKTQEKEVVGVQRPALSELLPQPLLQQLGLEAALVFRLRRGQQAIGFQTCGYRGQREVPSRHRRVAQGIAQIASLALTNAKL